MSLRRTKTKTAFVPSDKEPEDLPEDLDLGDMDEEDGGPEDAGRNRNKFSVKVSTFLYFVASEQLQSSFQVTWMMVSLTEKKRKRLLSPWRRMWKITSRRFVFISYLLR